MRKIAIIGAGYLQLPLYLKAIEMNLETIGFAWKEGAVAKEYCKRFYPISTLAKENILEVCKEEKIDGVLTIATDIAVPTVNYIADKMGLVANTIHSSQLSTNKFLMRKAFMQHSIKCPIFFKVEKVKEIYLHEKFLYFPLIVKPVDCSGSKGLTKVFNLKQLEEAVVYALEESLSKQTIIEEFVNGNEVSVEVISFQGKHHILTITDKVTSGAPHYVELEHHQPSLLSNEIQEEIKKETKKALDALEVKNGASHSEFIISKNDVYITEVGSRMGGDFIGSDLVYLSTGYDFLKGVIEVALDKFIVPVKTKSMSSGVYFYSEKSKHIGEIIRENRYKEFCIRAEITRHELLPLKQSADRSGYFIYQSEKKLII